MVRSASRHPCTIIIKLGTSSIVHETTHQPLLSTLSSIVETVLKLRSDGHKVVLVSSGAIGVGLKRMEMPRRPKSLAGTQALAAIGQGRLIALWDNLFGHFNQPIAQVLLTRGDIADRTRYLNAVNTLSELLSMGVVPIINENDTVSVSEIKFGDNDTLSAITSSMLHADYLFLLTDVDGLYTSNPRKDPEAKPIETVSSVSAIRAQVSTTTLGSKLGTGGMETKLIAAEIATAAGVTTIICSSKNPENIFGIIEYNAAIRSASPSASATPREPLSGRTSPMQVLEVDESMAELDTSYDRERTPNPSSALPPRPPHTVFIPSITPLRDLKSWTSHTLHPAGSVIIDSGAHLVLARRESGGRLLPAGVVGVEGTFASGQAVRIVVRRKAGTAGLATAAAAAETIFTSYANGEISPVTEPNTPTLQPLASMTSSISSLEPLSRSTSLLPPSELTPPEEEVAMPVDQLLEHMDEFWEFQEVGRGLANYNSAQINKVKGLKSSLIAQVLGYADSEYVVENVTIRVPP